MRWVYVCAAAALLTAGCGGAKHASAPRAKAFAPPSRDIEAPSASEISYLQKLGRWRSALTRTDPKPGPATSARCAAKLRAVGSPPTSHLRRARSAYLDACRALARTTEPKAKVLDEAGYHVLRADADALWRSEERKLPASGLVAVHQASTIKSHVDATFGRAATKVIGKRIAVRCFDRHDWIGVIQEMAAFTNGRVNLHVVGFAAPDGRHVNLPPKVCDLMEHLAYGRERPSGKRMLEFAVAVHVLAHESGHAAGIENEAAAECYSVQRVAAAARALGVEAPYAQKLQDVYWRVGYPQNIASYKTPKCRDRGPYDLHPRDAEFP